MGKDIILAVVAYAIKLVPREPTPRYQTPFFRDVERIDPLEKFMPTRFSLYDRKLDLKH